MDDNLLAGLSELVSALGSLSPLALAAAIILGTFGFIVWLPRVFNQRTREAEQRAAPQAIGNSIAIMLEDRALMERLIHEIHELRGEAARQTRMLEEIRERLPVRRGRG